MSEEGKRTEPISFKVTERMALDLLRLSQAHDRSISDYLYGLVRRDLYGGTVKLEAISAQFTLSDKVNQDEK